MRGLDHAPSGTARFPRESIDTRAGNVVVVPGSYESDMLHRLEESREREAALVRRARAGDREAFEELIRAHLTATYALLFRLVDNHEDAEDLAQECFVRAWRALPTHRGERSLAPWVRKIALHLARDHHRIRARRGELRGRSERTGEDTPESVRDARRGPSDEAGGRELMLGMHSALERLPARLRATLFLRVLEGLEYDEVGRAVGVTPATARTRVMQARKLLLRWMGPWLDGRRHD
jgi:RNA polymerase sigma-70 factor (ECF subfamily)